MKAALAILLVAILAIGAWGQGSPAAPYRIKPEDVLRILVYNENQVNADVPVGIDGNISAPFVGTVHVEGKTTAEVEAELTKLYADKLRIRDPKVSITIIRFRSLRASINGLVNRPGQVEFRQGDNILTLLSQGGGPVLDRADLRRATLRRGISQEVIPIDLYSMLIQGDTSQNYTLEDGDVLTIPEETLDRILVQGAVISPGVYAYKEPMTLADALSQAHGEIRLRSRLSQTMIIRQLKGQPGQYLRIKADFVRFIRKGDVTQNVVLMPGDLVYVPETNTPDLQQISSIAQSLFFINNFYTNGIFGIKPFGSH